MSVTSVTLPSQYAAGSYAPAFNPNATITQNVVIGEQQVVAANFGSDLQILVPSYAPFFANSATIMFKPTGGSTWQPLNVGTDYFLALPFISASRACGLPVFAGIVIANNQLAGTFNLNYMTLGGVWVNTPVSDQAVELLTGYDPYATSWEQLANYTQVFPNVNGPWDKTDSASMTDVIAALLTFVGAINTNVQAQSANNAAGLTHIFAVGTNPHVDTAAQIGLGNVANYPPAVNAQAQDPTNNTTYICPAQLPLILLAALPQATDTVKGKVMINTGTMNGDPTDNVKVLTAASFATLVNNSATAIHQAFNKGQQEASFSPYPFTFPKTWNGQSYSSMTSLLQAIQNYVGLLTPLEFSSNQGKIWFPAGVTVPSLALS